MPSYKYAEIPVSDQIEYYSNEDGLWDGYQKMHDFIQWRYVKSVARKFLNPYQYRILILKGEKGVKQEDIASIMQCTRPNIIHHFRSSIKILRKKFNFYLQLGVNIEGGFKAHCMYERQLKDNTYEDRFKM